MACGNIKSFNITIIFQIIRKHESQIYSWILFLNPMDQYLWIMLVLHSLFLVVILWSFWWYYNRTSEQKEKSIMQSIQEQVQHYLTMCSSYLGRSCGSMPHDNKSSIKEGTQSVFKHAIYTFRCYVVICAVRSHLKSCGFNYVWYRPKIFKNA